MKQNRPLVVLKYTDLAELDNNTLFQVHRYNLSMIDVEADFCVTRHSNVI